MPGTNVLRLPAASPLLAGLKLPKPRDRLPFLEVNSYPTRPSPLLFPSSSNPRDATIPIATSLSDVNFPLVANITIKTRRKWTSRLLPNPLQSGSEPLVAGDHDSMEDAGELRHLVVRVGEALSMAFPLWVSLACLLALWKPPSFLWVGRTWQIVGLTLTMLGMGMTLTLDDLRTALLMPRELAAGFVLQYTVMPMSGYLFSKLLKLPSYYAAGLILVACCPGGTASNIVTYLAGGNVALSVLMTATSTFTAAVMTPYLTSKLAGQFVAVDPLGLFISTVQNSVLGVVLAGQHFSNPLTAVPCAVSSICHSVYGSVLAGIWRSMPVDGKAED